MDINFQQDWIDFIYDYLNANNYPKPKNLKADELTHLFLNLRRRLVLKQKRNVIKSKEFTCPDSLKQNLKHFESAVKSGKELKPFLSTLTKHLSEKDLLINDWGIHHFHLGMELRKDGYSKRTGPLIFAKVMPDTIYFIQILPHGSWYKADLIEIIHNNWPDLIAHYKCTLSSLYFTEKQKENLRDKHANATISTQDGTTYLPPGGGFVGSGLNIQDVILTDNILNRITLLEKEIKKNKIVICKKLKRDINDVFKIKLKIDTNLNIIPYDFEKNIGINLKYV